MSRIWQAIIDLIVKVFTGETLAASARVLFGEVSEYRDIRITPEAVRGETIILHYHYHREELAKDKGRISQMVTDAYKREIPHLDVLLGVL